VSKRSAFYPRPSADAAGSQVVSHAGSLLLTETVATVGLDRQLSAALSRWRAPNSVHDPAKVLIDLALTLAVGGDCLADIAVLRSEPAVFGPVASDPTVSRLIDRLAHDAPAALRAIDTGRSAARARAWDLAGENAPDHDIDAGRPLIIVLLVRQGLITRQTDVARRVRTAPATSTVRAQFRSTTRPAQPRRTRASESPRSSPYWRPVAPRGRRPGDRAGQADNLAHTPAHDAHRDDPLRHCGRGQLGPGPPPTDPTRVLDRPHRRATDH
jgi:hypothetical protein